MDRLPPSGGQGQNPANLPTSGEQRPNNALLGSIPRKSLPPVVRPPHLSQGQGRDGHEYPSRPPSNVPPPPAGYLPPPHQYPPQQQQQLPSRAPPPPLNAPIPRKRPATTSAAASIPNAPIPRKRPQSAMAPPPSQARRPPRKVTIPHVSVKSEQPFVILIKTKSIPMGNGGIPVFRSSARMPKRKRPTYEELQDTDSDDFLTDSDEEEFHKGKVARGAGRLQKQRASPTEGSQSAMEDVVMTSVGVDGIDTPPPGTLSTLWYSREVFMNLFVLEKIIGWKRRPVVKLVWHDENDIEMLEPVEARSVSSKLLVNEDFWNNRMKRMEVSRIYAANCPVVMTAMAAKEALKDKPRYSLAPGNENEREEVLLVKWRGRSHMHCSWERRIDLEKFDASNNTAKNKIRRFFQGQEIAMGKDWKQVIETERAANVDVTANQGVDEAEGEELFPPQYLEIERILGCDENEMNMKVLANQRALNLRADQDALRKREEEEAKMEETAQTEEGMHHIHKAHGLLDALPAISDGEDAWDPEDNVRYIVKWKGLQYAEMTWEYWRDIKRDAVEEVEDFWYRQRAPTVDEVDRITSRPRAHVRDFRKLTASPEFAISHRPRPIADLGDGFGADLKNEEDEKEASKAFKLRGYQLEGVNWLLFNWFNKRSCILADEMGLGKTIQSVGFLHQLHALPATQVRGPFLIVAPLSLIGQWQSESRTWAPDLNVVFYHGSADARAFLVQQEFYYTDQFIPKPTAVKFKKKHVTKFHILITTYEVVLKDIEVLSKIRWKALIVDEAHRLKNPKARLFEELAKVPREFCLLLTGTPLQNSTEELWALLNFSDPIAFADRDAFVEKFGQLKDAKQVSDLHSMLKPYLLRRVKEDVEKSLPPKEETILEVTLTPVQKKYYKAIYEKNTSFLFKGAKPSNAPSLMNVMMELRKCCNHPFLIRGVEDRILHDAAETLKAKKDESGNTIPIDYLKLFGDQLVNSSGKMSLLAKLLPKLFAGGHKVLIFSQMVRCLDLLEEMLKMQHYKYERLDGSTTASARTGAVDRFHRKSCQRFVMLLSTRAGGLGLNLTAADVVIIFDSDWNPQNDLQAMARAHRIGQTRAVSVYRLLTAKTYEMHMFHSASMKLGLDRAVLAHQRQQETDDSQETKSKSKSEREVQAKEIDELLKKGAYDVFRDDDDTEAKQFLESDIDQLLERSAKKVTYGNTAASSISSGLGSFSKASFVADTGEVGGKDIDIDDPDFWSKAVGLDAPVETPEEVAQMIDDGVKRSRKQVQVFDPYAPFVEAEQKKKEREEQRIREEREEKERLRLLKKKKKAKAKEKKKREKEEAQGRLHAKSSVPKDKEKKKKNDVGGDEKRKIVKEGKSKKEKRAERRRALRRAEMEDPTVERIKQAWEVSQKNRATSAALRFGFDRFCKVRNESHLTSLPLQDLELFSRSYVYQLCLQAAVSLLAALKSQHRAAIISSGEMQIRHLLREWLGEPGVVELEFICASIRSVLQMQLEVENERRALRMPLVLTDSTFMAELRQGAGLRALRRINVLNRLNAVVEDSLDEIFSDLGYEERGRRGCLTKDLSTLDADLKSRHVTIEELSLALSSRLGYNYSVEHAPCMWWDRTCDVALLLGSFIHGFGNYEAIRNDDDLPFSDKIREHAIANESCAAANTSFVAAANAAKKVFDDAFGSAKSKAQQEVHAVVAAVYAATAANVGTEIEPSSVTEQASTWDDPTRDDTHLITLAKLAEAMSRATRAKGIVHRGSDEMIGGVTSNDSERDVNSVLKESDTESQSEVTEEKGLTPHKRLPMPDARVLDNHLVRLIDQMEGEGLSSNTDVRNGSPELGWSMHEDLTVHEKARSKALERFVGMSREQVAAERRDFIGIGLSGAQCGSTHRSLDDGTDYSLGAASTGLAQVATGPDAPRYLRALGVPMNITRYATSALVYADSALLRTMLAYENKRNIVMAEKESGEVEEKSKPIPPEQPSKDEEARTTQADAPKEAKLVTTEVKEPPKQSTGESIVVMPEIDLSFRDNASVRAGLCVAALHFGFSPLGASEVRVDDSIWGELSKQLSSPAFSYPELLFSLENLRAEASLVMGGLDMPPVDATQRYFESILLPHCLRLCVMGNGPSTRNARESRGKFETAYGISTYPNCSQSRQSPLPDPCVSLAEQSIEAVACASAILRRARMMRAAQHIVGGGLSLQSVLAVLQSDTVRDSMGDLPVWWCPEVHDLGLLVHAATRGLFSILVERKDETAKSVFSHEAIKHHIRTRFVSEQSSQGIFSNASLDDVSAWIEDQAHLFPSTNTLERRLGFLCSAATAHLGDDVNRYDALPMWDHGAWPRK